MTSRQSRSLSVPAHRLEAFEPVGLGVYEANLRALFTRVAGLPQSAIRRELQQERRVLADANGSHDAVAYETTLLVLQDYVAAGYYPIISAGRCFLAPIWESSSLDERQRKQALQRLYQRMRERELADGQQAERLTGTLRILEEESGYDPGAVIRLLSADHLDPWLTEVESPDDRRLWRAVRATWSMLPDRSAPGREVSFLLRDARYPKTPLGIFQFRNVVPEIKSRDLWMGISAPQHSHGGQPRGYLAAAERSGDPLGAMKATRDVLDRLFASINPEGLDDALDPQNIEALRSLATRHRSAFTHAKRERAEDPRLHLVISKRAETAAELCRGIRGFDRALTYTDPREAFGDDAIASDCDAGLRKIWHYHMGFVAVEVSICGAAPPFGPARIGKLMATLAGSGEALSAWGSNRPLGDIAKQVYLQEVRERIPNPGPIVLFTSGLYPGHSAQYTRVKVGQAAWVKYGDSSGYGGLNISNATTLAMGKYNQAVDGYRHITREFGEGSGARFREAGRALDRLNLPNLRKHNTSRPLYALPLVDDVAGVLFGWADAQKNPPLSAGELTTAWEQRWLAPRRHELLARSADLPDLMQSLREMIERVRQHADPRD